MITKSKTFKSDRNIEFTVNRHEGVGDDSITIQYASANYGHSTTAHLSIAAATELRDALNNALNTGEQA
jgi:hypothetical protein